MNRRRFFRFLAAAPVAIAAGPALAQTVSLRMPRLTSIGECGREAIIPLKDLRAAPKIAEELRVATARLVHLTKTQIANERLAFNLGRWHERGDIVSHMAYED